jgi:hypothetical protein
MNRLKAVGWPTGRPSTGASLPARSVTDVLDQHVIFGIELNRPGSDGGSQSMEDESHVST